MLVKPSFSLLIKVIWWILDVDRFSQVVTPSYLVQKKNILSETLGTSHDVLGTEAKATEVTPDEISVSFFISLTTCIIPTRSTSTGSLSTVYILSHWKDAATSSASMHERTPYR